LFLQLGFFHNTLQSDRYYAIATPSATQRLLLGLLEAPPSWAPDALDAAVQLVELLRAAEDYANGMRVWNNSQNLKFFYALVQYGFWSVFFNCLNCVI
jgi:hypothetical protein